MPDLAALANNPYLADYSPEQKSQRLWSAIGNSLLGLGAGIAQGGASGQPWFSGIAPGLAMGSQMTQQALQREEMERMHRLQMGLHLSEFQDKHNERQRLNEARTAYANGVPGGGIQAPSPPLMGVPSGGGGVNSNNIGNVRPVGASTGFQQPPDFNSGVALAVNNVKAYPKAFNGGQPMSLLQIGEKWAPRGDGANDPRQWAVNVSQFSGLPVNQPLNMDDPQVAAAFARGVHGAEHGAKAVQPLEAYLPGATGGAAAATPAPREPGPQLGAMPYGVQPQMAQAPQLRPPDQVPPMGPPVVQGGGEGPTPVQYQPNPQTPAPQMVAPPEPPVVPIPSVPPEVDQQLRQAVGAGLMTVDQAETKKAQIVRELHSHAQTAATQKFQRDFEIWKDNRNQNNKADRWDLLKPEEAQSLGLPPNVQFLRNKSGDIKPVQQTKEVDKDISSLYGAPDVQKLVERLSPADKAAFNAATKTGDHKGASAILTKGQTGLTEEQQALSGQPLIDTLPFGDKEIVGGLVDGTLKPSVLSKRAGNGTDINRYIALAKRVDPNYTPNDAGAREAFETNYMGKGQGMQTLVNSNTAMQHLDTYLKAQNALKNGDMPAINAFVNAAKKQFGDAAVPSAEIAMQLYAAEAAKAARGAGALNEAEEKQMQRNLATAASPAQAYGVAGTLAELVKGKVHALEELGRSHDITEEKVNKYFTPRSREIFEQVKKGPPGAAAVAPPDNAVKALQMSPNRAAEFDAKYGQGAAAKILGR